MGVGPSFEWDKFGEEAIASHFVCFSGTKVQILKQLCAALALDPGSKVIRLEEKLAVPEFFCGRPIKTPQVLHATSVCGRTQLESQNPRMEEHDCPHLPPYAETRPPTAQDFICTRHDGTIDPEDVHHYSVNDAVSLRERPQEVSEGAAPTTTSLFSDGHDSLHPPSAMSRPVCSRPPPRRTDMGYTTFHLQHSFGVRRFFA